MYFIGYLLSLCKEKYINWNWKQFFLIFVVSFGALCILNQLGSISLDRNQYENPVFLLCSSLAGWCFLYSLSYFVKQIYYLKKVFVSVGQRTLTVVILHFLSFKISAVFVAVYYGLPMFCVAAFPNLHGDKGCWWLLYTVVGVGIPVILNIIYHKFIVNFKLQFQ